jgi:hypothetical protein
LLEIYRWLHGDTDRVVEALLEGTHFTLVERDAIDVVNEWPDVATAARTLAAAGPSVVAIQAVGCEALHEVTSPLCDRNVRVRIASEFGWIFASVD